MGEFKSVAISGCNLQWFQKSLLLSQEVESSSTASVTRCNFFCNLCCNRVARKVACRWQRVACPLCNLSRNFWGLSGGALLYNGGYDVRQGLSNPYPLQTKISAKLRTLCRQMAENFENIYLQTPENESLSVYFCIIEKIL